MGDIDMVLALATDGIPCTAVAPAGDPVHYSRFTSRVVAVDERTDGAALADRLIELARQLPSAPVLFYQTDRDLLTVSRHRERLAEVFRFVVPRAPLVEELVDKSRFGALAARLDLPVPRSRSVRAASETADGLGLDFPLIVKPLTRGFAWETVEAESKAIRIADERALDRLWPVLAAANLEVLAQELVPGDESRIESYHAYVDDAGAIVAEFTGRKIRTYPVDYGHSTAVETTRSADVGDLGREILRRLDFRSGVAKVDFKRGPEGGLHLLEVNPRFSLWHHLGAVAGLNIPGVVYADLIGAPRPAVAPPRAGATWCRPWPDRCAARAAGIPLRRWLGWMLRADIRSGIRVDDPLPFVAGKAWGRIRSGSLRP